LFAFGNLITPPGHEAGRFRPGVLHLLIAAFVCVTVIIAGTLVVNLQEREIDARRKVDLLVFGSALQARLTRELNSVLFLTGGMSSYLVVRHADLQPAEVESILAALHRDSRHLRNFAVAVGYQVAYVYPVKGNEKVIGVNYPDIPDQWPAIKRAIDSRKPLLIGPLNLIQGGSGLIYRVPIFVGDSYWGLLSSVIDADSLLGSALSGVDGSGIAIAIRGKDGAGLQGAVFRGDPALFDDPDAQLIDVVVPGGKWVIALRAVVAPEHRVLWLLHGLVWLLALTLGWSALVVLMQRAQLSRLALFDAMTELPNRLLVEDRVDRAMSGLRRDPEKTCLLLFIDLDGFKLVNDRLGHRAGDAVLKSTARRIAGTVRETDTVGRWGGDEFIVFMENVDRSQIDGLIEKIRQAVELPTGVAQHQVTVGVSVGRAFAPDDGATLDELVRAADERMYADKESRGAAR
jgi:diguanylate cyclase (GGDEF)-like protein